MRQSICCSCLYKVCPLEKDRIPIANNRRVSGPDIDADCSTHLIDLPIRIQSTIMTDTRFHSLFFIVQIRLLKVLFIRHDCERVSKVPDPPGFSCLSAGHIRRSRHSNPRPVLYRMRSDRKPGFRIAQVFQDTVYRMRESNPRPLGPSPSALR